MGQHEGVHAIWIWLVQDVSLFGNIQSPLLSCLGAAGILILCLWHGATLLRGVQRIRVGSERIERKLHHLVRARQQASPERIALPALAKKQPQGDGISGVRRDLDDLEELDRTMRADPLFAHDWLSFRKTFVIEQPAWFMEPTVHAGQSAAGFFSFEAVCATHLNVRFYQQLPSILTNIGLLGTFLAILIGLSKLHVQGTELEGLQGLINGLAGKFVTSIVGLACGNAFLLLEKSLWHPVAGCHRRIVALLDEVFPQYVQSRDLRSNVPATAQIGGAQSSIAEASVHGVMDGVHQRLQIAVDALNAIAHSLALQGNRDNAAEQEQLAFRIGKEVRHGLSPLFDSIRSTLEETNRTLYRLQPSKPLSPKGMEQLVDVLGERLPRESVRSDAFDERQIGWRLSRKRTGGREENSTAS